MFYTNKQAHLSPRVFQHLLRTLFRVALEMLANVALSSGRTKKSAKRLAGVFAPVLYHGPSEGPLPELLSNMLQLSEDTTYNDFYITYEGFLANAIEWQALQRQQDLLHNEVRGNSHNALSISKYMKPSLLLKSQFLRAVDMHVFTTTCGCCWPWSIIKAYDF